MQVWGCVLLVICVCDGISVNKTLLILWLGFSIGMVNQILYLYAMGTASSENIMYLRIFDKHLAYHDGLQNMCYELFLFIHFNSLSFFSDVAFLVNKHFERCWWRTVVSDFGFFFFFLSPFSVPFSFRVLSFGIKHVQKGKTTHENTNSDSKYTHFAPFLVIQCLNFFFHSAFLFHAFRVTANKSYTQKIFFWVLTNK